MNATKPDDVMMSFQRDTIEDILAEDTEDTLKNRNEAILNLKDPKMPEWPDKLWIDLFDLGKACTKKRKKDRPKMPNVRFTTNICIMCLHFDSNNLE